MTVHEVLCPFWSVRRQHFTVRICDNLRSCVPACVADGFYPDIDPFSLVDPFATPDFAICSHFVRTDVWYDASVVKHGCFFGGDTCIHSGDKGFMSCIGCSRFVI